MFSNIVAKQHHKLFILSIARKQNPKQNVTFGKACFSWHINELFISKFIFNIAKCADKTRIPLDEPDINLMVKKQIDLLAQNQSSASTSSKVIYVDLSKALCNKNGCQIMQDETFEPFFNDDNHFALPGARVALDYIVQQVKANSSHL